MTTHGGARQKVRTDDRRGGARPGAGATQKRISLTPDAARQARWIAIWQGVSVEDYVISLISNEYRQWVENNEDAA